MDRLTASRIGALITALGVFAADRYTKFVVETRLAPDDMQPIIPGFFNVVRQDNPGIAFSMFNDASSPYHRPALVIFSVAAIGVLAWMLWKIDRLDRFSAIGLSLIFGGAIGNLFDRIRVGAVTDFLDFYVRDYHWYVFNIADTAVCIGAGLLILSMFVTQRKTKA